MLKWSPDDLAPAAQTAVQDVWDLLEAPSSWTSDFVEDNPRGGAIGHLNRLNREERDAVYALVEERIREDIEQKLRAERAVHDAVSQQVLSGLVKELQNRIEEELQRISVGAVELAITISEQIVRAEIGIDHQSMINRISTIISHVQQGAELKVIARPDDIDFLREHMAELERLNVTRLVPNQNLGPGSCLVTCEGREWDLTVEGQLAAMADMVREAILTGGQPVGGPQPEVSGHGAALV